MKDTPTTSSIQSSKLVLAMSRESYQILLIFALAAGLAFCVLSFTLFDDSGQFFSTVFCLLLLLGVFFLERNRFFRRKKVRPSPSAAMTDRTRALMDRNRAISALVLIVFLVPGLVGIWFGYKLLAGLVWVVSILASGNLGREFAESDSSD